MQEVLLNESKTISPRQKQIFAQYIQRLDVYVADLKAGKEDRVLEIKEFAEMMHIHPGHLSNTIKEVTGHSSCSFFEERLVRASKELLVQADLSIKEIAMRLIYDPSNFTKFFKRFTGMTPKQFRSENL